MEIMLKGKKAVIFDMDGVLVDSEKFWKQAEYEIFSELGVMITEEWSLLTQSMTTKQVTEFWYEKFPWKNKNLVDVEQLVIHRVINLIQNTDCCILGIEAFIESLKKQELKIGLATNSPELIIPVVLAKTNTALLFDVLSSADFEIEGKPNPAIYLTTAKKLKVSPYECLVIEDSVSGIEAAKRAGMAVVGFAMKDNEQQLSEIADFVITDFSNNELQ